MATNPSIFKIAIECFTLEQWRLLIDKLRYFGVKSEIGMDLHYSPGDFICFYPKLDEQNIVAFRVRRHEIDNVNRTGCTFLEFMATDDYQNEFKRFADEYCVGELNLNLTVTENSNGITVSNSPCSIKDGKNHCYVAINSYKDWEFFRYLSEKFGFHFYCGDDSYNNTSVVFLYNDPKRSQSVVNRSILTPHVINETVDIEKFLACRYVERLEVYNRLPVPAVEELISMYRKLKTYDTTESKLKDLLNTNLPSNIILGILDSKVHLETTNEPFQFIPRTVNDIPGLLSDSVKTVSDIHNAKTDRLRRATEEEYKKNWEKISGYYSKSNLIEEKDNNPWFADGDSLLGKYARDPALSGHIVHNSALVRGMDGLDLYNYHHGNLGPSRDTTYIGGIDPYKALLEYPGTPGQAFHVDEVEADEFKLKTKTKSKPSIIHIEDEEVKVVRIKRPIKRKIINIKH